MGLINYLKKRKESYYNKSKEDCRKILFRIGELEGKIEFEINSGLNKKDASERLDLYKDVEENLKILIKNYSKMGLNELCFKLSNKLNDYQETLLQFQEKYS